jgi:hypothetical protein
MKWGFTGAQDLFSPMHILAALPETNSRLRRSNQFSGERFAAVAWCPKKSPNRPLRSPISWQL